jgi:hypothetical protein
MFQIVRQISAHALRQLRRNRRIERPIFDCLEVGQKIKSGNDPNHAGNSRPSPTLALRCRICGSDNVMRDAWAQWDENAQRWTLGSVFDAAFCNHCEADTSLAEVPLVAVKAMAP